MNHGYFWSGVNNSSYFLQIEGTSRLNISIVAHQPRVSDSLTASLPCLLFARRVPNPIPPYICICKKKTKCYILARPKISLFFQFFSQFIKMATISPYICICINISKCYILARPKISFFLVFSFFLVYKNDGRFPVHMHMHRKF